eukprot:TRINITY_DN42199_c0_g1_i1.p1 TRINITY_DN42199_c0_g1~~TRINITY_DN42199_c0_g1_i1.p1  ORF type:complete len:375 (+),score=74.46 TRINITY_DN42199_c0_g1_i1:155-1126(+)
MSPASSPSMLSPLPLTSLPNTNNTHTLSPVVHPNPTSPSLSATPRMTLGSAKPSAGPQLLQQQQQQQPPAQAKHTPKQRFFQDEVQALILQHIPRQVERSIPVEITHFVQDFVQSYVHSVICSAFDRKPHAKAPMPTMDTVQLLENMIFCYHRTITSEDRKTAVQEYVQWKIQTDTTGFYTNSFSNPLPNPTADFFTFFERTYFEKGDSSDAKQELSHRFRDYLLFWDANGHRLKLWVSLVSSAVKVRIEPVVGEFVGYILWDMIRTLTELVVRDKVKRIHTLFGAPDIAFSHPLTQAYLKSSIELKQFEDASLKLMKRTISR